MAEATEAILVSDFARAEFIAVIGRLYRTGRLNHAMADDILAAFDTWIAGGSIAVTLIGEDVSWTEVALRRFDLGLRAPDALHIALARRLGATLVTSDRRMERAARALGVVTVGVGG